MAEIDDLLWETWLAKESAILSNPRELHRRLARARKGNFAKIPRAWCLAIRANDLRLNSLCHSHPADHERHHLTLDPDALRLLCSPVTIDFPGQPLDEVAQKLGVTRTGLLWARLKKTFRVHHVPGRRGRREPLLYTESDLDPAARNFLPPDPIWARSATGIVNRIPDDLSQTLTRIPAVWSRTSQYHDTAGPDPTPPRRPYRSMKLPPPEPDNAWYKWKGAEYIGYDWRRAQTNPRVKENYERHERHKAYHRAWKKAHPKPHKHRGSIEFRGWRFLCPQCNRAVKMLLCPLPPQATLGPFILKDLAPTNELAAEILASRPAPTFACNECQNVIRYARVAPGTWNEIITHLSSGLLYGREVPRPDWFTPDRKTPKHKRRAQTRPAALQMRCKVEQLLRKATPSPKICAALSLTPNQLKHHLRALARTHHLKSAGAIAIANHLGATLKRQMPHPKRDEIQQRLASGQSRDQIAYELGLSRRTIDDYAYLFRRETRESQVTPHNILPGRPKR